MELSFRIYRFAISWRSFSCYKFFFIWSDFQETYFSFSFPELFFGCFTISKKRFVEVKILIILLMQNPLNHRIVTIIGHWISSSRIDTFHFLSACIKKLQIHDKIENTYLTCRMSIIPSDIVLMVFSWTGRKKVNFMNSNSKILGLKKFQVKLLECFYEFVKIITVHKEFLFDTQAATAS